MTNDERIAAIRAHLPGDWYRMHPHAQAHYWTLAARDAGVTP